MKTCMLAALFAFSILGACASSADEEQPMGEKEGMSATATAVTSMTEDESRARTERRLQLERSMDQWWLAFQRQEYGKAEGVAKALENFVNSHFDQVVEDLRIASPRFRKVAAASLGFSGRQEAVQPLLEALRDPFADVLYGSLLSLWRLALLHRDIQIPAEEITPFLSHATPGIRSNAAMVMAHITKAGEGALFLPLTSAMEDAEPKVRVHAAAALGALQDEDAVPFLVKGLDDKMSLVRIRSALALGRIGSRRALRALVRHVEDPDVDVAKAAHKALIRITGQKIDRLKSAWENYLKNSQN